MQVKYGMESCHRTSHCLCLDTAERWEKEFVVIPSKYLVLFFSSELVPNAVEHYIYIYVSMYLYDYISIKSLHEMNFNHRY